MNSQSMCYVCPLCETTYNRKGKCGRWYDEFPVKIGRWRACQGILVTAEEYEGREE